MTRRRWCSAQPGRLQPAAGARSAADAIAKGGGNLNRKLGLLGQEEEGEQAMPGPTAQQSDAGSEQALRYLCAPASALVVF